MQSLLIVDAVLLGLALIQAVVAILFFNRFRAGLIGFGLQSLFLFSSALTALLMSESSGMAPSWVLTGLCALLIVIGFRFWRKPICDQGSETVAAKGS